MKKQPIGIFDSGVGGLTVWNEIRILLPYEDIIYLADSKNCPYGEKSHNEILELSVNNTKYLISQNCKAIVVACNTATAAAIEHLRKNFSVPFIGMEPAIKPAAIKTKSGSIGVLATKGTFDGQLFKKTAAKFTQNISTVIQTGDGLVELVENDKIESEEARTLIKKYIQPMIDKQVDHIVLGCTHYPFYIPLIKEIIPKNIQVINPAPAVAKQTASVINPTNDNTILGKDTFYTNGGIETLQQLVKKLHGSNIQAIRIN